LNKKRQEDIETLLAVADVEFILTNDVTTIKVPVVVPAVLTSALKILVKENSKELARIMGLAFLKVLHERLSVRDNVLWKKLKKDSKGGETFGH